MSDDPPEIDARHRRLVAYLRHNGERMLVDLLVLLAWLIATTALFGWLDLPRWLLYVVIFAGAMIYSRITPAWERPYRSPDLDS